MGILVDYPVDRATLDVLASAGILEPVEWRGGATWFVVHYGIHREVATAKPGESAYFYKESTCYLTYALLRFIEAEGLWVDAQDDGVNLDNPNPVYTVGRGPTLPAAVADYIKRKGE